MCNINIVTYVIITYTYISLGIDYVMFACMYSGTMHTGVVVSRGDMQKVMNQHQNNQFAQDVPFMGGDDADKGSGNAGTGVFDPGNVHSQVPFCCRSVFHAESPWPSTPHNLPLPPTCFPSEGNAMNALNRVQDCRDWERALCRGGEGHEGDSDEDFLGGGGGLRV